MDENCNLEYRPGVLVKYRCHKPTTAKNNHASAPKILDVKKEDAMPNTQPPPSECRRSKRLMLS